MVLSWVLLLLLCWLIFFIGYYETLWLNTFRECEINLHRRYVDDILCLFNCRQIFWIFKYSILTSNLHLKNKLINKFLFKCSSHKWWRSILHFRFLQSICDWLFYYLRFTPFSYKVGLVRTLLHCAFMISSNWFLFHEEVVKLKHYLEKKF